MPVIEGPRNLETPWTQWSGTSGDLLELLRHMEDAAAPLVKKFIEQETTRERAAVERASQRAATNEHEEHTRRLDDDDLAETRARLEEATARATKESTLTLSIRTKKTDSQRVTGTAEELAQWLRTRRFERIEFTLSCGMKHHLTLTMERTLGAAIVVKSPDSQWAVATFDKLRELLMERTPKLAFVRNGYFLSMTIGPSLALAAQWAMLQLIKTIPRDDPLYATAFIISVALAVLFGLAMGAVATYWIRRHCPGAELVSTSPKSRLGVLLGIVGTIAASIVVNLITG